MPGQRLREAAPVEAVVDPLDLAGQPATEALIDFVGDAHWCEQPPLGARLVETGALEVPFR